MTVAMACPTLPTTVAAETLATSCACGCAGAAGLAGGAGAARSAKAANPRVAKIACPRATENVCDAHYHKRKVAPVSRMIWLLLTIAIPHGRTHCFVSSARTIQTHWHISAVPANSIAAVMAARQELKDSWEKSNRYCFAVFNGINSFGHDPATKAWYPKICP